LSYCANLKRHNFLFGNGFIDSGSIRAQGHLGKTEALSVGEEG
jgi:hypothetical protein